MIKIMVELWPFGEESQKQTLAEGKIWNTGGGSPWLGSYGYELIGANGRKMKRGFLGEYKRKVYHIWWLVAAVMKVAYPCPEEAFRDTEIGSRSVDPNV